MAYAPAPSPLNIETPYSLQSGLARVQQDQVASSLAQATLPDKINESADASSLADTNLTAANSNLGVTKLANTSRSARIGQALIANAASLATTPDEWDDAMQGLVDKGIPQAAQYIGRYSEKLKGRVTNAFSAASPSSALEAMSSDSPTGMGGPASGLATTGAAQPAGVSSGAAPTDFDRYFPPNTPVQKLQDAYGHFEKMRSAINDVSNAQSPEQASALWDQNVQQFGRPDLVGQYSPQRLQSLANEVVPMDNYLSGRLGRQAAGVTPPATPAQVENVGGRLFSVGRTDPANPTATPLTPEEKGNWQPFTDANGVTQLVDAKTGQVKPLDVALTGKVGGAGANSVYAQKRNAWLDVHPGDTAGALDYASGKKSMTPDDAMKAAETQATRDLSAVSLAGSPPADADAYLKKQTAAHFQELTAPKGGPAADPTQPPPSALSMLQIGKNTTFKNGQVWSKDKTGKPYRVQ